MALFVLVTEYAGQLNEENDWLADEGTNVDGAEEGAREVGMVVVEIGVGAEVVGRGEGAVDGSTVGLKVGEPGR